MGKKARKTRWRTLTIDDNDYSDSEESSTTTTQRLPKGYQPKSYYNKFSYSSQSTPRRRYQQDSTKSTRSSSTASENKITFNEDEYTKITTPRQDVLFKKGYLNKPKNYQTQTSTGTSTTSTGNSTGNGTPDHQSTDLEYESQFVFPNGFVDHNGIYYINSYEPYPLMLYNPPTYYPEFSNFKSKRYSTGSLTESMSPNNEEATSQDMSGGEASNNVSDYSGHHQVYNMVYPGYYVNGVCPPHDAVNGQTQTDQTRRIKKRRRRKSSKSQAAHDSSEYTEDENDSSNDEDDTERAQDGSVLHVNINPEKKVEQVEQASVEDAETPTENLEDRKEVVQKVEDEQVSKTEVEVKIENLPTENTDADGKEEPVTEITSITQDQEITENSTADQRSNPEVHQNPSDVAENSATERESQNPSVEPGNAHKYELKPDAKVFIPRAHRSSELPLSPNVQFIKVPPSFIPIPLVPLGDFNGQNYNPAFIPPGIPINFIPPDPKMFPNFVGFVPNTHFAPSVEAEAEANQTCSEEAATSTTEEVETCDNTSTAKDEKEDQIQNVAETNSEHKVNSKTIDIATIVYKLEEAAKEQDEQETHKPNTVEEKSSNPKKRLPDNKNNRIKYKNIPNYKRNYYNTQNSPQRTTHTFKERSSTPNFESTSELCAKGGSNVAHAPLETSATKTMYDPPYQRKNPEGNRKNWKYQNGATKWQQNSPNREYKLMQNGRVHSQSDNNCRDYKTNQANRNYSTTLKNKTVVHVNEQKHFERSTSADDTIKCNQVREAIQTPSPRPKLPNQWISVSSRKKRKNKQADETEAFDENTDNCEDLFEKYDVEQLVDVIPPSQQDENITQEPKEEIEITDIINTITQNESSLISNIENISLNLPIRTVDDIEKELITKRPTDLDEESNDKLPAVETETSNVETTTVNVEEVLLDGSVSASVTEVENVKSKGNKKSKKGTQKPVTKRVIITDIDLSMNCEELKAPVKKIVTKISECVKEVKAEEKTEEVILKTDDEEGNKKNKKKKKKPSKTTITSSLSSSNTTINNMDDSYDFLLDSTLSQESVEKTNVEISQELDKIIQKGMYSNLEEKIKSLNIDGGDFFKSVFSNISTTKPNADKNGFNKTPDLSKILQDSRSLFRPSSVSEENNSQNKDINNKVLPDLDSPVEDGIFLETIQVTDTTPQDQTTTNDKKYETQIEDNDTDDEPAKDDHKTLYPITEAVKEWMSKTRETTPDIEILKSPHEIYEEFCDSGSETDTIVSDLTAVDCDEVTIFTKQTDVRPEGTDVQQQQQQDLMEFWENDIEICKGKSTEIEATETDYLNKRIEQGEEALETYDSKYGKNEDYLNLQKDIREFENSNRTKQGNVPYRAICCSIM